MIRLHKVITYQGQVVPQTYTACNGKYYIEKGTIGWNLNEKHPRYGYEYICTYETLRELREDITECEEDN